ncbi:carbon starvation CstA family protein [Rhizomicrobium electricum]|uniref:Carbon starvation protein A n=1 Tax=Rhizomicrobium electricum TaxID=480070 RepID=A0ABP3Q1Y2_9PROT|nr:carbon starvation protein A [Rhizomicrobium electricum]NIJ49780.1 carbon starvation protein [Rhizomicrobium electricum]
MGHALPYVLAALCILAISYRTYGVFFVRKILKADDSMPTPSHQFTDGKNYVPTRKWATAGQHFAAIAAAGPLVGPVLASQFGFYPGFIWLLAGAVIGGAVHDTVVLYASMRMKGLSLSEVARAELGPVAGWCTGLAMLFIITVTMAGLSMVVVNALEHNPWGTFAVFAIVPIAIALGLSEHYFGVSRLATLIAVIAVIAGVLAGPYVNHSVLGQWLMLNKQTLSFILPAYAFLMSTLPVWMLLTPIGYLSSFIKVGVFVALVVGVIFVNPAIHFPGVMTGFLAGGPVVAGPVWPFVSITIACGAISGFHAFVGSGVTPKIIDKWSDILPVAFGSMLVECLVGIMALVAACSLHPEDWFAINAAPAAFAKLGMHPVELPRFVQEIGIDLAGRTGGAVTLAVGMTNIFTSLPWFRTLASYFFQFVVMFEAVFILTAVDSGTRIARYLLQDLSGAFYAPLKRVDWTPGMLATSFVACLLWGYLLASGDISSIWALFGVSNQLMASVGLIIGATVILKLSRRFSYMLTCLIPLAYLFVTVYTAGIWMVRHVYLNPAAKGYNVFNGSITIIELVLGAVILIAALGRWIKMPTGGEPATA